ncbi:MAG TPA: 4Fe-4S binding protein [Mogibacterium sp.]|nr:4Fe-4S binding protein [Mogibacterium sp.]
MAKGKVTFNVDRCKGCELCAAACPKKIIKMNKTKINAKGYHPPFIEEIEECIACGMCATICPDSVITVEKL